MSNFITRDKTGPLKAKDFVKFQARRKIIGLCKNVLFMLEDVRDEKGVITNEQYQRIRKRVLDYGNDAIRELDENLDQVKIVFY